MTKTVQEYVARLLDGLTSFQSIVQAEEQLRVFAPSSPQAAQLVAMVPGCKAMTELIGMDEAKKQLFQLVVRNLLQKLLPDKSRSSHLQNNVVLGPPGVGKTSLLRAFALICSSGGITRRPHVSFVSRSDLVGQYLGATAKATKQVVENALGGLLVIDEVYSLGSADNRDSFAKEAIDTLTQLMEEHKEDLLVAVAGYEHEVRNCFFNQNKGLERRFLSWITVPTYSAEQLCDIFASCCAQRGMVVPTRTREEVLKRIAEFTHHAADMVSLGTQLETIVAQRAWSRAIPLRLPVSTPTLQVPYRFGSVDPASVHLVVELCDLQLAISTLLASREKPTEECSMSHMYC